MLRSKLLNIEHNRASSGALPSGPAPYVSSSHFRARPIHDKPYAQSWETRFSELASSQSASVLKTAATAKGPNGMITLGTGRPAPEFHPWISLSMQTRTVHDGDNGERMNCSAGENSYDLAVALNYGFSAGSPQLLRFVTEHVELVHNPRYADWYCAITAGTTSAIDLILQVLCDPGDHLLVEEYTYPGTLDAIRSHGLHAVGIRMDEHGLSPADLDGKLRDWDPAKGKKPSVLYMIPMGHNPTRITQPLERRKAIIAIAESHDLLVIEDDPYMILQLQAKIPSPKQADAAQTPED